MAGNTHNYDIESLVASDIVTDKAKEALKVLDREGTMVKAAKALGITKRSLQQQLARANKA